MPREPTKSNPVYQQSRVTGARSIPPTPSAQGTDIAPSSQDACGCTMCSRTLPVVFDSKYCDEGDCFVLCGNTAFQVHRFLFTRDSSVFGGLFRAAAKESVRHKNMLQISIHQHSARKMKDLLCVLYLLPQESKTFNAKASDVPALINAALMAEFFRFESVQKWILTVLATCAERAVERDDHQILKAADLDVIYKVAARCESETLLLALEKHWIFLIQRNVQASNPTSAIALAERFGRRRFKGRAYYEYLVQLWPGSLAACQLSPEQVAILARGFYSLCAAWGEIRSGPEIKCFPKRQYRCRLVHPEDSLPSYFG